MLINQNSSPALIASWQTFLLQQGFTVVGTANGVWGPNTEAGTKLFQSSQGLSADGHPGVDTIGAAERLGFAPVNDSAFPPAGALDAVIDLSHRNQSVDLSKAKNAGIQAVFHKATQSIGTTLFHDPMYHSRQAAALSSGILWGAYHFGSSGSGIEQATAFLQFANASNNTLLALDFEPNTTSGEGTMSVNEAADFINEIFNQTGKYPVLYGGSLLHQSDVYNSSAYDTLVKCPLWLAQYGPAIHLPPKWAKYTFWQYTDGNVGPSSQPVDGIGHCDREVFNGSTEDLIAFWNGNIV